MGKLKRRPPWIQRLETSFLAESDKACTDSHYLHKVRHSSFLEKGWSLGGVDSVSVDGLAYRKGSLSKDKQLQKSDGISPLTRGHVADDALVGPVQGRWERA